MILTFVSQNLLFGGLRDGNGNPEDRWPELRKRIERAKPAADFLLVQEAWGWNLHGHKQLARARNDLDMAALPLAPTASGNGTGMLYRPETVGHWQRWNTDHSQLTVNGFGVAAFEVGLPEQLAIMSVHLDVFGADRALNEIEVIINRAYRYGSLAVLGGDFNYTSSRGPQPDYKGASSYEVQRRVTLTNPEGNQPLEPDRRVGWKLEQAGFVDVAYSLFEKTRDNKLLETTVSNPDDRFDQFWVSKPVAPAITAYGVMDTPKDASDHKGIWFQLDTKLIKKSGPLPYR